MEVHRVAGDHRRSRSPCAQGDFTCSRHSTPSSSRTLQRRGSCLRCSCWRRSTRSSLRCPATPSSSPWPPSVRPRARPTCSRSVPSPPPVPSSGTTSPSPRPVARVCRGSGRATGPRCGRRSCGRRASSTAGGAWPSSWRATSRVGRVAVNVTAGAGGFSQRRFVLLSALAATSWAAWSVGIGALAGSWVEENPVLGAVCAVALAAALGWALDATLQRLGSRARA